MQSFLNKRKNTFVAQKSCPSERSMVMQMEMGSMKGGGQMMGDRTGS